MEGFLWSRRSRFIAHKSVLFKFKLYQNMVPIAVVEDPIDGPC